MKFEFSYSFRCKLNKNWFFPFFLLPRFLIYILLCSPSTGSVVFLPSRCFRCRQKFLLVAFHAFGGLATMTTDDDDSGGIFGFFFAVSCARPRHTSQQRWWWNWNLCDGTFGWYWFSWMILTCRQQSDFFTIDYRLSHVIRSWVDNEVKTTTQKKELERRDQVTSSLLY